MSLFIKYLSISLLSIFIVITVTSSSDFGPAFASNGYSFDFGYQKVLNENRKQECYLFIDKNYWTIELDFDQQTACFSSKPSYLSDWFGNQFLAAFDYEVFDSATGKNTTTNMTVLLKKDHIHLDWGYIEINATTGILEQLYKLTFARVTSNLVFSKPTFVPTVGFRYNKTFVCFLNQISIGSAFEDSYRCVAFNNINMATIDITNQFNDFLKDQMTRQGIPTVKVLEKVPNSYKVMAIFTNVIRFAFIVKIKNNISYCFTKDNLFNIGCLNGSINSMVNCSELTPEYNTANNTIETLNTTRGEPENSFGVWIGISLLFFSFIIGLTFILFIVFRQMKPKITTNQPSKESVEGIQMFVPINYSNKKLQN